MITKLAKKYADYTLIVEAITVGLAFGSLLLWASTCLVGSFRPRALAEPYWSGVPNLQTDTSGFAAFIIAAVSFIGSECLRLRRRQMAIAQTSNSAAPAKYIVTARGARLIAYAACEAIALMATSIVGYLSVNAVTHPSTLMMPATHLLSWPTEGTLRMIALILCVGSIAVLRFLRAESGITSLV
jgi:hypothetical protein